MGAAAEAHLDAVEPDLDARAGLRELAEQRAGAGRGVVAAEVAGQQAVEGAGHQRELEVGVNFQRNLGGERVHVEEVDGVGDRVLDEHAAGVAVEQGGERFGGAVGEQQNGLVVAEVEDGDLADGAGEAGQVDGLIERARVAVAAADVGQPQALPVRVGRGSDGGQDLLGAAAKSEEADAELVELGEVGVGGEGAVEDEFARVVAGLILPSGGEAQDLVVLVLLADGGVGVAEDARVGVAGEEGEDALLAAAALGEVVFLDQGVVAVIGNGVEVEVEGVATGQFQVVDGVEPEAGELGVGAGVDAAGVCGEGGALGDSVQAAEEGEAGIAGLGADVGVAGAAVEFEGEQGAEGAVGGDPGAAGHGGLAQDVVEGEASEEGGEEEEAAEGGAEGARLEVEFAAVGGGGGERAGGADLLGGAARELGDAGVLEGLGDEALADGEVLAGKLLDDFEHGEVALAAQLEDAPVALGGSGGRRLGFAARRGGEEEDAFGADAEVAAEVTEGAARVAELESGLGEGEAFDAMGAQGFVLAVVGSAGLEEVVGKVLHENSGKYGQTITISK